MYKISLILWAVMGLALSSQFIQAWDQKPPVVKNVTLLHVGKLLAVPGQAPLTEQTIVIEGKRIKEIQSGYVTKADLNIPYAKVVDLKDKFVLPGLMDVHVHLTMVRGEGLEADDWAFAGVINAKKTLMAGYTTVRDIGAQGDTIFKLRDKIKKGEIEGPRIFAAGQVIGVGPRDDGMECNGPESCRRTTRDMINRGADWIKIYASCSGIKFCSHKDGAGMFFDDEIEAVIEVAKKYDIKVAAHSHPRDSALQVLKFGISAQGETVCRNGPGYHQCVSGGFGEVDRRHAYPGHTVHHALVDPDYRPGIASIHLEQVDIGEGKRFGVGRSSRKGNRDPREH